MIKLVELLKNFNESGLNFLSTIIEKYNSKFNFELYVINDKFNYGKWHEITNIVRYDGDNESVEVIDKILCLLEMIISTFRCDEDLEDNIDTLDYFQHESEINFLKLTLKSLGVE